MPADSFVILSTNAYDGLTESIRELGWIADGGDKSASSDEMNEASEKKIQYERDRDRVAKRLIAYLAKKLSINPPTDDEVNQSAKIAAQLAQFHAVNVKAKAVIEATTKLLEIYAKT